MSSMTHKVDMAVTIPLIRDAQANPKEQPGRGLSSPRPTKPTSIPGMVGMSWLLPRMAKSGDICTSGRNDYEPESPVGERCAPRRKPLPGSRRGDSLGHWPARKTF